MSVVEGSPLELLRRWIDLARETGLPGHSAVAFVTAGADGRPSARTVLLKRLDEDGLLFTSALWTRKAREIAENPNVALLFHWPAMGRQVHLTGRAEVADRELASELFGERDIANRMQTIVSRQGEPIEDIAPLRERHEHLLRTMESAPQCPPDWGAIRVAVETVEFWTEAPDRMHDRLLYSRRADGWEVTRLAP